jgi:DNA-binding response OmpR family regulator
MTTATQARTILVVEDQPAERQLLCDYLESHGFAATCVGSLSEGRRELATGGYGLLVVDAHLPDGSGIDLVAEAAASGAKGLLVSGHDRSIGLLKRQNIPHIQKPFELDALVTALREMTRAG